MMESKNDTLNNHSSYEEGSLLGITRAEEPNMNPQSHSQVLSRRSQSGKVTADQYVEKRRFGRLGKANVDDSESDDNMDPDLMNKTPNTKRKAKEELVKSSVKKLGPVSTFLTLIKGFICTGILYLPKAFVNGGWLWTSFMLLIEAVITTYCGYLLLEVRAKTGLSNYSEIGQKTYGNIGRIAVDISLWFSQMGFCCAYVFFIKENLSDIFKQAFGWNVSPNSIAYV